MRRLIFLVPLLFPILLAAQEDQPMLRRSSDWVSYPDEGCIGGSGCADRRLRVALDDRPVIGVRFFAHDAIGAKAEGALRVKIDGNTVDSYLDVPRSGKMFNIDVEELLGRYLVFEPATNDEVEVSKIEVLYSRDRVRRTPQDPWSGGGSSRGGWRSYASAAGCIGGDQCRKNGNRITIALEDAPVIGVRFYAHDNIGTRADGKLSVRVDSTAIASYVDVQRNGKLHEFEVDNVRGTRLVIEAANDDEVEIKDVAVLYGRGGGQRRGGYGGGGNWQREVAHEGGCIGGNDCGGRRARIRIPIFGRSVATIRFYARDDVGTRAEGQLRIRIDDEVIQDYLDIKREGRTYDFDGRGIAGDYVILEPASDDEIVIRDVRITFAPD
jgi:hypothetical protein